MIKCLLVFTSATIEFLLLSWLCQLEHHFIKEKKKKVCGGMMQLAMCRHLCVQIYWTDEKKNKEKKKKNGILWIDRVLMYLELNLYCSNGEQSTVLSWSHVREVMISSQLIGRLRGNQRYFSFDQRSFLLEPCCSAGCHFLSQTQH